MPQEAIPFEISFRSFGLAVLLLIAIVYAIRLIDRHLLPYWLSLQRRVVLWVKRAKVGDSRNQLSDIV